MIWQELFQMQKKLDEYIVRNNKLEGKDLFDEKYLALLVEIGELANETRCFKYWSTKPSSQKQDILEEFVDGIHFLMSLGIEKNYDFTVTTIEKTTMNVTEQFNFIYASCVKFKQEPTEENYVAMFSAYLQLGELLGFSLEDIKNSYYEKNKVNYERQLQGY